MGRIEQLNPQPKNQIKTLQRIGYDLNAAIGDIVDNSIAADAKNISIYSPPQERPTISIIDDGHGMNEKELLENMRIACKNPNDERNSKDLGRFGSGMKTASFSVANVLTVVSKSKNSKLCACRYDIDLIVKNNRWDVEILTLNEIRELDEVSKKLLEGTPGTQVIWSELPRYDSLRSAEEVEQELAIDVVNIKKYVALYFHRFMTGKNKISFNVNGQKLIPIDPFLIGEKGYTEGPSDSQRSAGGKIDVKVHILPHHTKLSPEKLDEMGGVDEIAKKQGFYIFRGKRLIVEGGWLNLAKSSQLGKLARIQVDVPTSMDEILSTDVKKQTFQLPGKIRHLFKRMISSPVNISKRKYTYRGKTEEANDFWDIKEDKREKKITYEIKVSNKKLIDLVNKLKKENRKYLIGYLKKLSEFLPVNHIYNSMSSNPNDVKQYEIDWEEFEKKLKEL